MSFSYTSFLSATAISLAAMTPWAAAQATGDSLVIQVGHLITQPGEQIENGVIVIEGGRITAIGKQGEVEVPWDAPVIGSPEHWAMPGFVEAYTSEGMDRPNENLDVAPYLDVRDSIDPINVDFEDYLRWGVTTINVQQGDSCVIGARGRIVKPTGITVEEMTVRPLYGMVLSVAPKQGKSHATQIAALRNAFDDLRIYLEEIVQDKRDGGEYAEREALYQGRDLEAEKAKGRAMGGSAWKVDGLELIPRGAIDEKQEPLLDLVEGRYKAFIHCQAAMDVHRALEVAKQNGFLERTVLVVANDAYKAAHLIAEAGVPVVLSNGVVYTETDPVTGEEQEIDLPERYAEAGVRFAISSDDANSNSLWFQAQRAMARGMDQKAAFEAVTTVPAEILGVADEVGSLAVGKHGNVLLLTSDPMSTTAWIDHVIIEGRHAYDRSKDSRNEYVYEGEAPIGAQ